MDLRFALPFAGPPGTVTADRVGLVTVKMIGVATLLHPAHRHDHRAVHRRRRHDCTFRELDVADVIVATTRRPLAVVKVTRLFAAVALKFVPVILTGPKHGGGLSWA